MPRRWVLPAVPPDDVTALCSALEIATLPAKVMLSRGLRDPEAARQFLTPSFERLHDPCLMRSMPEAVARLITAVRGGEKILIYGDYDVDGTASVVLLTKAIELAGGSATFHVPHRLKDGYGMRPE